MQLLMLMNIVFFALFFGFLLFMVVATGLGIYFAVRMISKRVSMSEGPIPDNTDERPELSSYDIQDLGSVKYHVSFNYYYFYPRYDITLRFSSTRNLPRPIIHATGHFIQRKMTGPYYDIYEGSISIYTSGEHIQCVMQEGILTVKGRDEIGKIHIKEGKISTAEGIEGTMQQSPSKIDFVLKDRLVASMRRKDSLLGKRTLFEGINSLSRDAACLIVAMVCVYKMVGPGRPSRTYR